MTTSQNFVLARNYALIFAGIELLDLIIHFCRVPFFKKLENYVKRDVKLEIIKNSFNINIGEYEKLGNGAFITRLTSDLDSLANSFKRISETVVDFMSKIGFIVFVFIVNYWIGLFLVAFIVIRYLVYLIRMHYFAKLKPGVLKHAENINSVVGESIGGIKDIKSLGLSDNIVSRVNTLQTNYMKADNKEWYVGIFLYSIANFVKIVCNLLFILLCIHLIRLGNLDLAVFYSVYVYKNSVMEFAVRLGELQDYFKEVEVNASRVFQLSSEESYAHDKFGDVDLPVYNGNIEFKNVSFEYVNGEPVLDNVSFKIEPNTHVAFVGESGCGKSTVVSLICKLYEPTSGEILFDGVDSKTLSQNFGKNVSMVNQSPYLFNMTIRENMQLVNQSITDEQNY